MRLLRSQGVVQEKGEILGIFPVLPADLRTSLRRKDIMRCGLWPPVGLASGVTWPDLRHCKTGCGTAAAAMWATTLYKQVDVKFFYLQEVFLR